MGASRTLVVVCALTSVLSAACGSGSSGAAAASAQSSAVAPGAVGIYDDALLSGWIDWSWSSTRDFGNASPVHSGARSLAVTFQPWGGAYFRRSGAVLTGQTALQLWVNGGAGTNDHLWVVGVQGDTQTGTVDLGAYCDGGVIPANAWARCQIPLTALGPAGTTFDGFWLQESWGNSLPTLYLDDVALTGAATTPPPTAPAAPANLSAAASTGAVSLSWSASSGATGYDVYRATSSGGTYVRLTAAPQAATTYRDTAVTAGRSYWYRIRAVNAAGSSPASSTVRATVPTAPPPVVAVTVAPGAVAIDACKATRFTATVTGATDTSVTWSVQEGASGGTIDAAGNYTAPSSSGTYHVVARSNASSTVTASVPVTVQDRILSVAVSPASATLATGGKAQLAATVTTTCGTFAAQ